MKSCKHKFRGSYKGWIKPGQLLLVSVNNRKGRFIGSALSAQCSVMLGDHPESHIRDSFFQYPLCKSGVDIPSLAEGCCCFPQEFTDMTFCALLYMQAAYRIRSYMFLYFHFSLCDVWVWDSKGTMLADRLTKIEDATFGNHVRQSSFDGLCLKKMRATISFAEGDAHGPGCRTSR